ncbi:unnamed protein product [Sphagnum balticum]
MIIAAFTEYVTSHQYYPVRELAEQCKVGPASNVTLGLALGYMSTLVPAVFIAVSAYVSNRLMGYYGVALAALGMLSNLPLSLAIDGYGPISDNAGGIAEMAEMGEEVRDRTDALDAAGNTTAAIGKGFAIGSAALVSLSLFGGFLPGAIVSGVQLAISAANTGGAWDNAKKYIESGAMIDDNGAKVVKGSDIHKAAVVGDTVGDPLKDTSGPALNILIKLMAIISLVFGSKFA